MLQSGINIQKRIEWCADGVAVGSAVGGQLVWTVGSAVEQSSSATPLALPADDPPPTTQSLPPDHWHIAKCRYLVDLASSKCFTKLCKNMLTLTEPRANAQLIVKSVVMPNWQVLVVSVLGKHHIHTLLFGPVRIQPRELVSSLQRVPKWILLLLSRLESGSS